MRIVAPIAVPNAMHNSAANQGLRARAGIAICLFPVIDPFLWAVHVILHGPRPGRTWQRVTVFVIRAV
jgi:hypothetical protein